MKKIISLIAVLAIIASLSACGTKEVEKVDNTSDKIVEDVAPEPGPAPTKEEKLYKVSVSIMDVAANEMVIKEISLPESSPTNIANAILKELNATDTVINSVREDRNRIYIDFKADSGVLKSGTAGETAILDSLGTTFVDELGYQNIFFTVDGGAYESGHFAFGIDEPYM